jgi:hypothetical protein
MASAIFPALSYTILRQVGGHPPPVGRKTPVASYETRLTEDRRSNKPEFAMRKYHGERPLELGIELGLRIAEGWQSTPAKLIEDFRVSRATAYRLQAKITCASERRAQLHSPAKD